MLPKFNAGQQLLLNEPAPHSTLKNSQPVTHAAHVLTTEDQSKVIIYCRKQKVGH